MPSYSFSYLQHLVQLLKHSGYLVSVCWINRLNLLITAKAFPLGLALLQKKKKKNRIWFDCPPPKRHIFKIITYSLFFQSSHLPFILILCPYCLNGYVCGMG